MSERIFALDMFERFLSPLSAHAIEYKGIRYATVEHAYHAQRYSDQAIVEEVISASSAQKAWEISQKYKTQQLPHFDSKKVSVMEDICRMKLEQHEDVRQALLESGDQVIIKNYTDSFWGIGPDGTGRNEMGRIWMRLREEFQKSV